ncbi:MAG: hypothetical protein HZA52_10915 [Planctomycetes bacterium]|nr:hypothetical protein [Planctomycetota bacterium]
MESKSKQAIAGGVIAVCAVALAIQWWPKRVQPAPLVTEKSVYDTPPTELTAGFDGSMPEVAPDGLPGESSSAPPADVAAPGSGGAPAGSDPMAGADFESLLAKLEALHPRTRGDGALAALASDWTDVSGDAARVPALPDEHLFETAPVEEAIAAFVEAHPLTGVIHSERLSSALFGGYVVRVGEHLPGLDARVDAVDSRGVSVSSRGRTVVVPMPPFVPRAPASTGPDPAPGDPSRTAPSAGPALDIPVPTSNPAPVPAPAKQETVPDVPHQD